MTTPKLTCLAAALLVAASAFATDSSGPNAAVEELVAASRPPNIVLVVCDDLGFNHLGCYGQRRIRTPHLDRMAAEGVRFTRVYAGASLCLPSRVSMLTGLHLGHSRVRRNGGGGRHEPIQEEDITIARVLKRAGYRTGMIGKWALGDEFVGNVDEALAADGPGAVYKHGWDYYFGEPNQTLNHEYYPSHVYTYDPTGILGEPTDADALTPTPLRDDPQTDDYDESYTTDAYTRKAIDFIGQSRDRRFFLYLAYQTPHFHYEAPEIEPYAEQSNWPTRCQAMASMITRLDRNVGAILAELRASGVDEQTLVVFTSDHGADPACDEWFDNNGELAGFKGSATEGGLRVPFIARWPGKAPAATVCDKLLALYDLMPTFAEFAGVDAPHPIDGVSVAPCILGTEEPLGRRYVFCLDGRNAEAAEQRRLIVRGDGERRSDEEILEECLADEPVVATFPDGSGPDGD